ncbi:putative endo-1,4-beta-xylanase [Halenospora varia]|nr:putative endo-1,4-beta-xylanase [Halenospora varia]
MQLLLPLLAIPLVSAQLHELAVKAGKLYFGTATDSRDIGFKNATYLKVLNDVKEFGQLTHSNGQKWFATEPAQGQFNFTYGEEVSSIARKNKQLLRCHTLVWHSQLAPWVDQPTTPWTKATLTAAMINHVTQEAKHWSGQCYAWDVVNEALNDDGTLRNSTFLQVIGPEYIKIAFRAASRADPKAKLYYNDYNIEKPGNKSAAVRELVRGLKKEGIRIDGVGLQSHFTVGTSPTVDQLIWTMEGYTKLGVEVALTELDIRIKEPETTANLAQQSVDYKAAIGACMQVDKCVGVTVWDFWDPVSWVPGVFAGFGSPSLWFGNFTKHPAYQGVVEALKNDTSKGHGGWGSHDHDDEDDDEEEGGWGWWKWW